MVLSKVLAKQVPQVPLTYRAVFISDVHLGTAPCRAADLLQFLDAIQADKLFLVGDIIDLERMKSRPRFPDLHRQVVNRFIRLANSGTEVVYIPGNHDHEFRDLVGRDVCGVPVRMNAEYVTADGRRLLVAHGDELDSILRNGTGIEAVGAAAYAVLMQVDVMVNQFRERLGHDHLSISRHVKLRLSSANEFIARFEVEAARYAAERGYDGIVCGHIHRPGVRVVDDILYCNDGDWVEHRTALAETCDGRLELLRWERDRVAVDVHRRGDESTAPLAA